MGSIQKCNVKTSPDTKAIDFARKDLEMLETKIWLRGKQELWCLIAFLNKLEKEIKDDDTIKPLKIRSQITPGNAVELLAPRLACPQDLKNYVMLKLKALLV